MPRSSNSSSAANSASGSSPLGPFKTSSSITTPPMIPSLPSASLASSSFAAPPSSSTSSPLAPTLPLLPPPLPVTDAEAADKAFAELEAEEKAEGTGRMWDRAETERLHKDFQKYWDANKKAPPSQLHEQLGLEYHRSWRSIQCKWYEWAKVHLAEEKEARKAKEPKGEKPMATRMWTQKDTERLHTLFKQEWDKTGKGPKSKWHAYTALLFKRSKRAIQGKWYEWAKVAGIGLRAWPKVDGEGRITGGMLSDSSDDSEGEYPQLPDGEAAQGEAGEGGEKKEGERKESEAVPMTDAAGQPILPSLKTEASIKLEKQARKRRREERRSAPGGSSSAAGGSGGSSTLDTLRLSPSDFQHILELRVGGINFGTLLMSSGDQPSAVQLQYKEGQTVTWNNPAFPAPPASAGSSSSSNSANGAAASPSAADATAAPSEAGSSGSA